MVSNESGSAQDATGQFQEQLLGAIQTAQEATSAFVNAWFLGASQMVAAMATLNSPEPAVTLESNQLMAFMNQLFSSQQEFLTDLADKADPVSFMGSLKAARAALVAKPDAVSAAAARLALRIDAAARGTIARASGESVTLPIHPSKGDKRFSERAYRENPLYVLLVQQYLLGCQYFD